MQKTHDELLTAARTGDANARRELIEAFMPIAGQCALRYAKSEWDDQYLDMRQDALTEAIKVIDRLIANGTTVNNANAYVRLAILKHLQLYHGQHDLIRIPKKTLQRGQERFKQKSATAQAEDNQNDMDDVAGCNAAFKSGVDEGSRLWNFTYTWHDPSELRGIVDALEASCNDDLDRNIVNLRSEDFTDAEISEKVNVSTATVWNRRKAIEHRFNETLAA